MYSYLLSIVFHQFCIICRRCLRLSYNVRGHCIRNEHVAINTPWGLQWCPTRQPKKETKDGSHLKKTVKCGTQSRYGRRSMGRIFPECSLWRWNPGENRRVPGKTQGRCIHADEDWNYVKGKSKPYCFLLLFRLIPMLTILSWPWAKGTSSTGWFNERGFYYILHHSARISVQCWTVNKIFRCYLYARRRANAHRTVQDEVCKFRRLWDCQHGRHVKYARQTTQTRALRFVRYFGSKYDMLYHELRDQPRSGKYRRRFGSAE
jgi:hypothetical protein